MHMYRESGVSVIATVAVVAVLAAGGAGYFAWQNMGQLDRVQSELNTTKNGLSKMRGELKQAAQDLAAATKEAKDLKAEAARVSAERDAVRATIENEQASGVRLRAELALAREQISYLSARSPKDVVKAMPKVLASK